MRDFDDFLPFISPYAKAAPELAIFRCLRDAATRFCERTKLWRDTDTIRTTGLNAEPITLEPDAVLMEVLHVAMDCRPLDPISLDELARFRPTWRTDPIGCGSANRFVCPEIGLIQPVPRTAGTLTVEFNMKPSEDAETLPDFMFDLYRTTIANGAAGMVLIMPNDAFGNPQLGAGLIASFNADLDRLSTAGRRGQQRGPARTRSRYF